ncbi:MAG: helix-turn-helix transcriptional regulator [Leptolyngbyaceae cyanobacterium RM2_2_4]|nr:helix-turn-helix transcriptional regulator [Leptolyngbyaceae cyanobacterium SM1_4_3]NJN91543.1 helix-turn-helix transcriptional regulator [Leptolyngbyaceae cyanobacterium SL_5_14]NJO49853.1 helix-turn-helix transcriptional regulator [Leptolyngbyaceae cyanobacterium RM2_2_4]
MLELATLGFLQKQPLHGYRLKQQLELFMSGCISVNYGAIYPLLKRLEARGDIVTLVEETGESNSGRKEYCITDAGRDRWRQKMLEYPHESWVNSRSRFIIKYFFFSHLHPIERIKLLEQRLLVCRLRLQDLEREDITSSSDRYEATAWRRHLANLRFEIDWLLEQLKQEKLEDRSLQESGVGD